MNCLFCGKGDLGQNGSGLDRKYCNRECLNAHNAKKKADIGSAPDCLICGKKTSFDKNNHRWKLYCSSECYNKGRKTVIKNDEAPKCEREGCDNKVKWIHYRYQTYCSQRCRILCNTIPIAKTYDD